MVSAANDEIGRRCNVEVTTGRQFGLPPLTIEVENRGVFVFLALMKIG